MLLKILLAPFVGLGVLLLAGAVATLVLTLVIEARYPPQGRFVTVRGGRMHVVEMAPKDREPLGTIVLLHGASGNAADPIEALGRQLAERYRVVALDRPGHGWSDRILGTAAAVPARQAALVAEALRALKVEGAVVVGHSWAGAVVPNLALDHADVTAGIVLLSPVTHPWPGGSVSWYYHPATSILGWIFTRTITTPAGYVIMSRAADAVFAPQPPEPNYVEIARVPLVLRPKVFQANAADVAGLHDAVTRQKDRYRDIRMPATVVAGEVDKIVSTGIHARSFAREVPGAKLVVLPGIGHMPHYAVPDAILREIDEVAAKVRAPRESRATAVP